MADVAEWPGLMDVLARWVSREVLTAGEAEQLADYMRGTSFSLAQVWNEKTLEAVKALVTRTIADGLTVKEFRELAKGVLERFESGWYADLVYRVNQSNATAAGNYAEMWKSEWIRTAPYWRFVGPIDDRNDELDECPNLMCRWLKGRVFDKRDASARRLLPPVHFQCRHGAQELTAAAVSRLGYKVTRGSDFPYDMPEGWDADRVQSLVPDVLAELH